MQRDASTSRPFLPPAGWFFPVHPAPSVRLREAAPVAAERDTEPPPLFATITRCLVRLHADKPVGGDASPVFWR